MAENISGPLKIALLSGRPADLPGRERRLAVIGGVITMGRSGVGAPSIGAGTELDAIAAVVIGGASLMGGAREAFSVHCWACSPLV